MRGRGRENMECRFFQKFAQWLPVHLVPACGQMLMGVLQKASLVERDSRPASD